MQQCNCELATGSSQAEPYFECQEASQAVDWRLASDLSWCSCKHFLLNHMPAFDLDFLPPAVTVEGDSMLDDTIAFALMAWNASMLTPRPPVRVALAYLLPYATYHESRANWRPLFFAKYFAVAQGQTSSKAVVSAMIQNNAQLMNWTAFRWPASPRATTNRYELGPFASGSTPPTIGPFDFTAYGYGSCTGWAKFLASALKAVGVPAREVGSPCWNTIQFAGLAINNPNVSFCWNGGRPDGPSGGVYLNNHNWVEYWDNVASQWRFVDVATGNSEENTWFCGKYTNGCDCSSPAGKAARDHDIVAPTWSDVGDDYDLDGGKVLNVRTDLVLSSREAVTPLVWSPRLRSPLGRRLKDVGLRVVNRTAFYRCQTPLSVTTEDAIVA